MASSKQHRIGIFGTSRRAATAALAMALLLTAVSIQAAHAQQWTIKVLHPFTGGADGALPLAGLTMDGRGNLYGTANVGGSVGAGTVFKLKRSGSDWTFSVLYAFTGNQDGRGPQARVIFGPMAISMVRPTGGGPDGHGVVFALKPSSTFCRSISCPWTEAMIYRFTGGADGNQPETGDVAFDAAGHLYGTTAGGGSSGQGVAYKLTPSHGTLDGKRSLQLRGSCWYLPLQWHDFRRAGNWYGTTTRGGAGYGTVYELMPSGSGWEEKTLYTFQGLGDGGYPYGGLIFDQSGNPLRHN